MGGMMKTSNRWLSLAGIAVIVAARGVVAYSDDDGGCITRYFADGDCDVRNNNAECGFDSGDCCACTCVSTEDYTCGGNGYGCVDPDAACVDDDDITIGTLENCGDARGIGDGYCDMDNNKEECSFDGGDCCECTCTHSEDDDYNWICRDFACVDPSASCVDDDDITIEMIDVCSVRNIGDGYCDSDNNNALCAYDGGDCCECTCVAEFYSDDYSSYSSCANNFACIDPEAPCVDDDDITIDTPESCDRVSMGNAYCNEENNNAECGYDGGDCCECTCEDRPPNTMCGQWSSFACIDPDAACVNDDDITIGMIEICDATQIGNGWCNEDNNNAECNYDGGDCCECTCESATQGDDDWSCGRYSGFACIDPSAPCVDDDSVTVEMIDICRSRDIGNGYCDDDNNNADCAYDGGDCCECTCTAMEGSWTDDYDDSCRYGFACIDPDAPCVDDDEVTVDMYENCGYVQGIGNGYCDDDNNTPECGYDGGDCCECTCVPNTDTTSDTRWQGCKEFACIDPEATCVNDDDITVDMFDNCEHVTGIGNGYCDQYNNIEECGYDGGDCCSCTCESSGLWDDDYACSANAGYDCKDETAPCFGEESTINRYDDDDEPLSFEFVPWEQEGDLPTMEGAVEAGEKTEVAVTATAFDVRPGASSGQVGCGEGGGNGCEPLNSRDGISSEIESRWSCATKIVPDEGPCQIEYTFAEAQDIMDIQVAFWRGNERTRTLEVHFDGMLHHTHESYSGSTFNNLAVVGTGVTTVMLQSIDLLPDEWISLIEVLIFVAP